MISPIQKKLLKYLGYPVFYLACLLLFVRLTFPYETLKNRVVAEFNRSQSSRELSIRELSGSGIFGLEAEGIRLTEANPLQVEAGEKPPKPLGFMVESAVVRASLLSYLFGDIDVSYDLELGGGTIEGGFNQSSEAAEFNFEVVNVDISEMTLLSASIGLPIGGELNGQVELYLPGRKVSKAEGKVDLKVKGLAVGDGKAKIRNTIALPRLNAGDLTLRAVSTGGRLELEEFGTDGPDLLLEVDGKVRLKQPFDGSILDLSIVFKFKDAYTQKSDITKSLFGEKGSKLPALFDMDPQVRKAKNAEGKYSYRASGSLARPNFRPGAKKTNRRKRTSKKVKK